MAGMSKQLRGICPQDAASCAQHTKCPGCGYMTSVSGQGGRRSPAEGKALALERPLAWLPMLGASNVVSSPSGPKVQSPQLYAPAYTQQPEL